MQLQKPQQGTSGLYYGPYIIFDKQNVIFPMHMHPQGPQIKR